MAGNEGEPGPPGSPKQMCLRVILVGGNDPGKTSLINRIRGRENPTHTFATIGVDFHTVPVVVPSHFGEIGGKKLTLQIWDTAGSERYNVSTKNTMLHMVGLGLSGVVFVYDISSKNTLEVAKWWINQVENCLGPAVASGTQKLLLGNKCDLEGKREVSTETGMALAKEHGFRFMEVSALTGLHVGEAFELLTVDILIASGILKN